MKILDLFTASVVAAALFNSSCSSADDRIWLKNAAINGKSVKLCFDSGSNVNALSPEAVKRLGLATITNTTDSAAGFVKGIVEHCTLSVNGIAAPTAFVVLNLPNYVASDFDGIMGWYPSENVVQIDAKGRKVDFFSKVPRKAIDWVWFSVITNLGTLNLQLPHTGGGSGVISIDTGSDFGIGLPPRDWQRWKRTHPRSPTTLKSFYTPNDGFVVLEEAWVDRFAIGPLVLTDVPVIEEVPSAAARWADKDDGTLGLVALKRMDLVVDGANSVAYAKPKTDRPSPYPHNRLGAIFVPRPNNTNFVAHVVSGSPAYEAGVREGDILLQVDGIRVVGWTSDWNGRFYMPPGTKLHLELQRYGTNFNATAVLRNIIPPSPSK